MKLFILICTLPERALKLKRLMHGLTRQLANYPEASYKVHDAGRAMPTGTKRNQLIEQTESDYFCFIDDDDQVSEHYLDHIMNALQSNPDVVTFNGWYTEYGVNKRNFTIRLGSKYYENPRDQKFYYHRFPNHLAVFKRPLVRHIKFPDIHIGEDYAWAKSINDKRLLRTEVHINEFIYHYDCHPSKSRLNVPRTHIR